VKKLSEYSFREIDRQFMMIQEIDAFRRDLEEYDIAEDIDAVFVYAYIDYEIGVSFELLGFVNSSTARLDPVKELNKTFKIRYKMVEEAETEIIKPTQSMLQHPKVQLINQHYYNNEVRNSMRTDSNIDELRSKVNPDDVTALIIAENGDVQQVWVRLLGVTEDKLVVGELQSETYESSAFKKGEKVIVSFRKSEDKIFAVVNKYTAEV